MHRVKCFFILAAAAEALISTAAAQNSTRATKGGYLVYVGTYTGPESKGIYAFRFQPSDGSVGDPELVAEIGNPSWVTVHPNRRFLYTVTEYNNDTGTISAFRIDQATGKLSLLNSVSSSGRSTCHLSIDRTGRFLAVASYHSGTVAVRRIQNDGSLGELTAFDQHPGPVVHAHSMDFSPDNRFALGADLGLDKVFVYRFDAAKGALAPNEPPFAEVSHGWGPRHLDFDPTGNFVYVFNEIAGMLSAFKWNGEKGELTQLQTISTIPEGFAGKNNSQEVQVRPDGKFLYASNGGASTIAVFARNPDGTLTAVEQVPTQGVLPRHFAVDPTGSYLLVANQKTNNIVLFRIDRKSGRLTPTGKTLSVGAPVCLSLLPLE